MIADGKPLPVRVWQRAMTGVLACILLLLAVYLLAVWTPAGQRFEDAVLSAAERSAREADAARATGTLNTISGPFLLGALVVVPAIGLLRRRPFLGSLAAGVVVASVLTTEVLQRSVLRPVLLESGQRREDQSFPSGHTSVAMSVLCALALVTPYRFRGAVVFLASLGATSVEVATVTASWHRPSDTIGSDLIVVIYTCVAVAVLARQGRVSEATLRTTGGRATRAFLAGGYAGVAVVAFGVAVVATAVPGQLSGDGWAADGSVLTAGRALALSGSAAVPLALLALLHRIELAAPRRGPARVGESNL
ncbi:PAP2 superfamily protein [Micromonospora rhizosphaerae]|uniref:PAP2 superfamily protein n=1 Tax=Micromonospora rhizosphaerae TaxID=568872 RepID=A0A1C6SXB5_9ACTN|nr:phosphatase PAP2 family protein [Micromonospora rhizosphaerae]SCL34138.1 PAP2 superfamily protein [Micromonospora rhizosphaerae]